MGWDWQTVGQRRAAATEFISGSKSFPKLRSIWAWSCHSTCWRQMVSQRHCGTLWFLVPDPNTYMSTGHSQHLPLPLLLSWHVLINSLQFVLCLEKLCKHFSALPGIYFLIPVCPEGGLGNDMLSKVIRNYPWLNIRLPHCGIRTKGKGRNKCFWVLVMGEQQRGGLLLCCWTLLVVQGHSSELH